MATTVPLCETMTTASSSTDVMFLSFFFEQLMNVFISKRSGGKTPCIIILGSR
jgi:hypothetical protein